MPMDQHAMPLPVLPATRFISYSANLEDVILNRIFRDRPYGFFVDVGAADPKMENDCKALYDRGWRGINIEPNPSLHASLLRERPGDVSLGIAVDETEGEARYHEVEGTGLSTLDDTEAARCRSNGWTVTEHRITTRRLGSILAEFAPGRIDLLKLDVEGWEEHVLRSNDWPRFRPDVILVEATMPERPIRRETDIAALLAGQDYQHVHFDGLNDFYVRRDVNLPEGCFATPPNVFDHYESYLLGEQRDLAARQAAEAQGQIAGAGASLADTQDALAASRDQLMAAQAGHARAMSELADAALQLRQALLERDRARQDLALRDHELAFNADRNRSLEESVSRLQAECERYADHLEAVTIEREELIELRSHCHTLFLQETAVRAQLVEAETAVRAHRDTQAVMEADLEVGQRQLDMLRQLYADSQAWLSGMRDSTSWRLTRPIRAMAALFRPYPQGRTGSG